MTGFRVSEHRNWREPEETQPPTPRRTQKEPKPRPPGPLHQLLLLPARIHHKIFGPIEGRRPLFLTTRFLLVLIAVMLILQGVSGSSDDDFEVGEYKRVTEPETLQAYLAPASTHKFPIDVAVGERSGVTAFFTQERAIVRLPTMSDEGPAYGLQIGVRHDQSKMDVTLMIAKPAEGFRTVTPTSSNPEGTQFEAVRFADPGEYRILVRSTDGIGSAKILVSIVEAPLESEGPVSLDWLPLISGSTLATVLAGPYLPGAQRSIRATRKPGTRPGAALAVSFAHLNPGRGVDMRGASAEALAARSQRGWVIREE